MKPSQLSAVALSLALFLGAAARPASAAAASPYGVNVHVPQGAALAATLDRVKAAGIGWVRIDMIWAAVETRRGVYNWRAYDAIAAAAKARGIEVYATLAYTPGWATDGPALTGVPRDPEDWRRFCFRAARRYKGKIRFFGLWNEPNLPRFWSGTRQQYIDVVLKTGADGLHAGNPAAQAGGPDLAHLTSGEADWYDWLRAALMEAGGKLDFITHHLYDTDGNFDVTAKLEARTTFGGKPSWWDAVAPSVREVLQSTGWTDKPFWLTETGWESAKVGEDRQAAYTTGLFDDWLTGRAGRGWVSRIFVYEIQDPPASEGLSWGLLRADGSAKPAYNAVRAFAASHPGR
jgi:hypothetical protein